MKYSALIVFLFFALAATPALARGGSGTFRPSEYRDPNAWNGDSGMSVEDKARLYTNCHLPEGQRFDSMGNVVSTANANYTNTNMNGPVYDDYEPKGQVFNGPLHLQPSDYEYVVQNYKWASATKSSGSMKPIQRNSQGDGVVRAKLLGH